MPREGPAGRGRISADGIQTRVSDANCPTFRMSCALCSSSARRTGSRTPSELCRQSRRSPQPPLSLKVSAQQVARRCDHQCHLFPPMHPALCHKILS